MENQSSKFVIDAQPHYLSDNINANVCEIPAYSLKTLLRDFTIEEYKSMFFLLMDFIGPDDFFNMPKDKSSLIEIFFELYIQFEDCNILVELFGTMKKYKILKSIGTCRHVYKKISQERKFNHISALWKMLYSLCEELNNNDLEILKQEVPDNFKEHITTLEDWFCWAINNHIFSEADFSKLEIIFNRDYPKCLDIIKNFQVDSVELERYKIRRPTTTIDCGIALIFAFDEFDEKSKLKKREGSDIDVDRLKALWQTFGLKTVVLKNLTFSDVKKQLDYYATLDHSNYDLFICCILSHGKSNSVYSYEGISMNILDLISIITGSPNLDQKPKLFFIQACQGLAIHQGVGRRVTVLNPPDDVKIDTDCSLSPILHIPPILCDTLEVTSSIDGFVSFRDVRKGSWFIQALYNEMMQLGDKCSILEVMTMVNKEVRERSAYLGPNINAKQIVKTSNSLGKTLILKKRTN